MNVICWENYVISHSYPPLPPLLLSPAGFDLRGRRAVLTGDRVTRVCQRRPACTRSNTTRCSFTPCLTPLFHFFLLILSVSERDGWLSPRRTRPPPPRHTGILEYSLYQNSRAKFNGEALFVLVNRYDRSHDRSTRGTSPLRLLYLSFRRHVGPSG